MPKLDSHNALPKSVAELDLEFGDGSTSVVGVFDFDGVLCDAIEDRIYRLDEQPGERPILRRAARHYGVDFDLYDLRYARHLIFQAIQAERSILPSPGPLLDLARDMSKRRRPFFILTARSGPHAVQRVTDFLAHHGLEPQEVFFVGRVAKGRQLSLVRSTVGQRTICYFEDSPRHLRNGRGQTSADLRIVAVGTGGSIEEATALWNDAAAWFDNAHPGRKAA